MLIKDILTYFEGNRAKFCQWCNIHYRYTYEWVVYIPEKYHKRIKAGIKARQKELRKTAKKALQDT